MYPWLRYTSIYKYTKVLSMRVNGHWPILLVHSTKVIRSSRIITLGESLAGSCGSLLDDLIREWGEVHGASMKKGSKWWWAVTLGSLDELGKLPWLGCYLSHDIMLPCLWSCLSCDTTTCLVRLHCVHNIRSLDLSWSIPDLLKWLLAWLWVHFVKYFCFKLVN